MKSEVYKSYLQNVLGITTWLRPKDLNLEVQSVPIFEFDGPLRAERAQQKWSLITLHFQKEGASFFEGESRDLFQKMKSAMKLNTTLSFLDLEADVAHQDFVITWVQRHLNPQVLLILTASPRSNQKPPTFETWDPASLLQNGERKKETWEVMQRAMRELKN